MPHNRYQQTVYLSSAHRISQLPADKGREVAFAGRSNSGKSSVINALTLQKSLARTSKQPGRTQLINLFRVDAQIRLVDLPGYGYARVSETMRRHWGQLMQRYFEKRQCLVGLVLIIDIRRGLTSGDEQMLHWCIVKGLPVHVLLNKADKLSRNAAKQAFFDVEKQLVDADNSVQLFSATKKQGLDELIQVLDNWLQH